MMEQFVVDVISFVIMFVSYWFLWFVSVLGMINWNFVGKLTGFDRMKTLDFNNRCDLLKLLNQRHFTPNMDFKSSCK